MIMLKTHITFASRRIVHETHSANANRTGWQQDTLHRRNTATALARRAAIRCIRRRTQACTALVIFVRRTIDAPVANVVQRHASLVVGTAKLASSQLTRVGRTIVLIAAVAAIVDGIAHPMPIQQAVPVVANKRPGAAARCRRSRAVRGRLVTAVQTVRHSVASFIQCYAQTVGHAPKLIGRTVGGHVMGLNVIGAVFLVVV